MELSDKDLDNLIYTVKGAIEHSWFFDEEPAIQLLIKLKEELHARQTG